jgi:pSer/pThr/pTyr-binding forkhead associated (FHA) protein
LSPQAKPVAKVKDPVTEHASLTEFWRDCQAAPELRLLVDRPPNAPQGIVLQSPFAVVGRDDGCDLVVSAPEVSRRHLYLQVIAGELWSFDLASRTGLFLGEQRLQAVTVTATDGVRVGPCCLHPLADAGFPGPGDPDPLAPRPEPADPWPTVTLEFKNATQLGGGPAPVWQLDRTVTFVGQALQCKVRFKCPSVSRVHCALLRTPGGVWVIDLLGRNGISVNGSRVRFAKLTDGTELRVGRFRMVAHQSQRAGVDAPDRPQRAPATRLARHRHSAPDESPAAALFPSELMISAPPPGSQQALAAPLPELPVPPGLDSTQSMLLTMMHQFSTMQQQMFDQFQQTTLMMMQMFGSLQKDQFELVRQELEGLRELNREMNTVQGELAKHKAGTTEPQTAKPKARRGETSPRRGDATGRRGKRSAAPPRFEAPRLEPRDADAPAAAPAQSAPSADAPAELPAVQTPAQQTPAEQMTAAQLADATTPAGIDAPPGTDVHEWLCQRFADLQQERQTRWQRLMGVLTGK